MIYALDKNGEKIEVTKNADAVCPCCGSKVIAKMGAINIHHWAHLSNNDCEYSAKETEWHLKWKSLFNKNAVEVPVINNGLKKIADLRLKNSSSVEFQKSQINPEEIIYRENIHGKIIWVLDLSSEYENDRIVFYKTQKMVQSNKYVFRYKWAKKHFYFMSQKVFDLSDENVFVVDKFFGTNCKNGYGQFISKIDFINNLKRMQLNVQLPTRHITQ